MAATEGQAPLRADGLFSCEGLVALVTGGGTGIGYMIANSLLQNGASKVYISGRRPEVLANASQTLGPRAVPLVCDVTSPASLSSAAAEITASTGHLDLLVCNAGISGPQVSAPGPDTSLEEWAGMNLAAGFGEYAKTFEVNLVSAWYTVMAFLPLLGKGNETGRGWGSQVVVTSSIAAFNKTAPGGFAYGQSKAAVDLMVKQLAVALPKWNIRVNSICPGLFPSELSAPIVERYKAADPNPNSEATAVSKDLIPAGRLGDEKDIAGAILYLASRAGAYCNGNSLIVDGGRLGTFPSTR